MEILFNRVFKEENTTSSLRKCSSPLFLQEFRPLTPLKEIDRFTSLTVIGMTKIMCNTPLGPGLPGCPWCNILLSLWCKPLIYLVTPCFPQFVKITGLAKNYGKLINVNM
jgi:hypothetical protein